MSTETQITGYIDSHPEPKRSDMQALHQLIQGIMPASKWWFLDGRNGENKVVSNPNIGYGSYTIEYADGSSREFYQIGLSANTAGISVYVMGIDDKHYLPRTYAAAIGKASVSGYCIKFKKLKDIDTGLLAAAIRDGLEATNK